MLGVWHLSLGIQPFSFGLRSARIHDFNEKLCAPRVFVVCLRLDSPWLHVVNLRLRHTGLVVVVAKLRATWIFVVDLQPDAAGLIPFNP